MSLHTLPSNYDGAPINANASVILGDVHISRQNDGDMQRCLADLLITDPRHDKIRIEATKGGLLEGSYRWILDHEDFQQWYNGDGKRVLWIEGDPGKGKTMLLIGIINELESRSTNRELLSFFFCQFNDLRTNNGTAVLRGLIYLLVLQQPSLASHIQEPYKNMGRSLFEDVNAFTPLSKILQRMLSDSRLSAAYLVIDALDECVADKAQLLDLIVNISSESSSRVKWLVSSRSQTEIELHLWPSNNLTNLKLQLHENETSHAIDLYVDHMVSTMGILQHHEDLQLEVRQRLRQMSDGTFLWVALVVQQLQRLSCPQILTTLDNMPVHLMTLWDRIIRAIEDEDMIDTCRAILSTVVMARRPLHLLELQVMLDLQEVQDKKDLKKLVDMCGSFLTIRDDLVYVIHQSAREYLLTNSTIFPDGPMYYDYRIFLQSLSALSRTLRKDICNLRHPGTLINGPRPADYGPLTPVDYCCQYWLDHLLASDLCALDCMHDISDEGIVFEFLQAHFLHWLECSSLIYSSHHAIINIKMLLGYLKSNKSESSSFIRFLKDAERFTMTHGPIILRAPLQIYGSALVFSPAKSEIKEQFWNERLQDIGSIRGINENWGICQQTLEGHKGSVWAVAFSPDGHLLASGSNDKTIQVWDTRTGASSIVLEVPTGTVRAVVFSPDNSKLASGSHDGIVRIWDHVMGRILQALEGHTDWVSSVCFSPDSCRLVSASKDGTIRLWDATSGECLRIFNGHSEWLSSVAFSPDGQQLVSTSHDRTARLWDVNTGVCQRTIRGFKTTVNSAAFSPDCRRLVSASDEPIIRIWDPNTGVCIGSLEGHSSWVSSVAFSPDGCRLVSTSNDKTIRLWDTATTACLQILRGHGSSVNSASFSPNGQQIASGSNDWSVRLWDTSMETYNQTTKCHGGSVTAVALSSNGQWLASASSDKAIRLWDTKSASCQRILTDHGESVTNVKFSPDSLRLASASEDKTIRLWNTHTGAPILKFEGHGGFIRDLAFSFDGLRLVSSSEDGTVRLWNATDGKCKRVIKVGKVLTKLAFTTDDRYLQTSTGLLPLATDSIFFIPFRARSSSRTLVKKNWVNRDGQNLIWLPRDYRAGCWISHDTLLVLGHESGQVTFLEFNPSMDR